MKKITKRAAALLMTAALATGLCACAAALPAQNTTASVDVTEAATDAVKTFKVGICNYVDDASLNQMHMLP